MKMHKCQKGEENNRERRIQKQRNTGMTVNEGQERKKKEGAGMAWGNDANHWRQCDNNVYARGVRPLFKPRSSAEEGWVKFTGHKYAKGTTETLKTEWQQRGYKFISILFIVFGFSLSAKQQELQQERRVIPEEWLQKFTAKMFCVHL